MGPFLVDFACYPLLFFYFSTMSLHQTIRTVDLENWCYRLVLGWNVRLCLPRFFIYHLAVFIELVNRN